LIVEDLRGFFLSRAFLLVQSIHLYTGDPSKAFRMKISPQVTVGESAFHGAVSS
jgi:hypothetical protein